MTKLLRVFLLLMNSYSVASFVLKQPSRSLRFVLRQPSRSLRLMSVSKPLELEVEQKFALLDGNVTRVEARLMEIGFRKRGEKDMVDWYFDTPDPNWILTPRDCWLRYREVDTGAALWQLKRGRRHEGDGATVYEELEGDEAIEASLSVLANTIESSMVLEEFEGRPVPKLPRPLGLVPFARIETHRSSWTFSDESEAYDGLTVDLDGTQYGYMVGEVEAVVSDESNVPLVKERIINLIRQIFPEQDASSQVPVGKLEHFLIRQRPEHYKACIEGGSIQDNDL